ncbi:MAG TPA: hypothetical protein DCF91_03980 [Porphyromonadaceae bacterium]|nr:hypothetical protein [Porphyromonadaceae bacterium]
MKIEVFYLWPAFLRMLFSVPNGISAFRLHYSTKCSIKVTVFITLHCWKHSLLVFCWLSGHKTKVKQRLFFWLKFSFDQKETNDLQRIRQWEITAPFRC